MRSDNETGVDWTDRESRNKYHREWKRNKYHTDPEYKKKVNELNRKTHHKLWSQPEWKEEKKSKNKENSDERFLKNKTKAFEYIGNFGCSNPDCKHTPEFYHDIDWHHQIPENKTKKLSHLFRNCSWERCKEEIDSGDVMPLCAFCHRYIESQSEPIPLNTEEGLD